MANSATPVHGLGGSTPEDSGPRGSATGPRPGMWEVFQYFGLRQHAVVLSSSSRTELKARLSSKSLSLFSSDEGGETGPGRREVSLVRVEKLLQVRAMQPACWSLQVK